MNETPRALHRMNNLVIFPNFYNSYRIVRTVLYAICAYVQAKISMTENMFGKFRDFVRREM